jgi:hypothetical protein
MCTESRAVGEKGWRGGDAGAKRCDSERNRAAEIAAASEVISAGIY